MLNIRKCNTEDAAALSAIGGQTFYDTFRPHNTEEDMQAYIQKAYSHATIEQNLNKPDITYYLCEEDAAPVGYIKLITNMPYDGLEGRCIELEKIYVQQNYFGKQAGQLLMDKAIEHATLNNFECLFLGVWKENIRAVKFYEKNGFTVFGERSFQLGERLCEDYMMCLKFK